jgi:hypothetical protein
MDGGEKFGERGGGFDRSENYMGIESELLNKDWRMGGGLRPTRWMGIGDGEARLHLCRWKSVEVNVL